jgi:hypothetical protein
MKMAVLWNYALEGLSPLALLSTHLKNGPVLAIHVPSFISITSILPHLHLTLRCKIKNKEGKCKVVCLELWENQEHRNLFKKHI